MTLALVGLAVYPLIPRAEQRRPAGRGLPSRSAERQGTQGRAEPRPAAGQGPAGVPRVAGPITDRVKPATDALTLKQVGQAIVNDPPGLPDPVGEIRRFGGDDPHTGPVVCLAVSPDRQRFLSGGGWPSGDTKLRLWEVKTGRLLSSPIKLPAAIASVAFSPHDARRAVVGCGDGSIWLWDMENAGILRRFHDGHQKGYGISGVAFTPDGRRVVSTSFDKTMRVWDMESGKELRKCEGHSDWIFGLAVCFDGRHVLTAGKDWTMRLWDIERGQELRLIACPDEVHCVAFSPIDHKALSGGRDGKVRLWEIDQGQELQNFAGHSAAIVSVAFGPDGRLGLSGGLDRSVRLWSLVRGGKHGASRMPMLSGSWR